MSPDRLPFVSPSAPTALTSGGLADGEPLPRTFKHLGSPTVVTGSLVLPVSQDSSFKGLFALVIYLLELWEFIGFVPTKQHSTVTVLQRRAGVPGQIKMFLNV